MRACETCATELPPDASPLKRYCGDACRKRRQRVAGTSKSSEAKAPDGPVTLATRARLGKLNRLDTLEGATALVLAARLDRQADTGSAMATLSRELRSLLEVDGDEGPVRQGDEVDELSERRDRRIAG